MKTRKLGQSGIDITEIGLGTNYVGGHNLYATVDEDEGIRLVHQAIEHGITFIDTADIYGMGRSEELVGRALAGRRHEVVLATKGAVMFDGKQRTGISNDPAYLRQALEASLQRLTCDYVDLYYIHNPDKTTPPEEAFGALMQFKEEGLIRAAGVSNFDVSELESALKAGPIDALQCRYNLLQRDVESDLLPFCQNHQISFIPWGPLAFGLLGGAYSRNFQLPENDWRSRSGVFDPEVYTKNLDIVDQLRMIATGKGMPTAHVAMRWLLSRPAVASVIAGAKRVDQVEQNAQAGRLDLTSEDIAVIDALTH